MHSYPSQCESQLSVLRKVASRVASSSSHYQSCISTLGSTGGGSVGILMFHTVPAVLHLGKSTTSRGLGVGFSQPFLDISGKLCLSSSCISPSSSAQVSGRTCHTSIQTFALASNSSQHVWRHSWMLSCHKGSFHGFFGRPGTPYSAISTFNPLAAQRYMLCRQWVPSSVCQVVTGATWLSTMKVSQQCCQEWADCFAWEGVPNNPISAHKWAEF